MHPDSKSGYYTEKSPKTILLEWTQQQKRQKPRYKVMAAGVNFLRCKVLLTHLAHVLHRVMLRYMCVSVTYIVSVSHRAQI